METEVQVQFDRAGRHFGPGEPILGSLSVRAGDSVVEQVELSTVLRWHGKGTSGQKVLATVRLTDEPIAVGATRDLSFRIDAPRWPPTYHGTILSLSWSLLVSAGSRSFEVPIVSTRHVESLAVRALRSGRPEDVASGRPPWRTLGIAAAICVGGIATLVASLGRAESDLAVIGGLVAGFALLPMLGALWGIARQRAIGRLQVRIRQAPGAHALDVHVWMKADAKVGEVRAHLFVFETAERSHPDNNTSYEHLVYHETSAATATETPGEWRATLMLPDAASTPCSFEAPDGAIAWTVRVDAEIPNMPDAESLHALAVVPSDLDRAPRLRQISIPMGARSP